MSNMLAEAIGETGDKRKDRTLGQNSLWRLRRAHQKYEHETGRPHGQNSQKSRRQEGT